MNFYHYLLMLCNQVSSHKKSEDSGERWLTGIMEIPTSIDERLKNVEQTELATQKLLKEKQMRFVACNLSQFGF